MDSSQIREFLENYRNIEPYEKIYSTYLYVLLALSTILTALLLYYIYNNSKLSTDIRCIFLHFGWTCYGATAVLCLWQVDTKYLNFKRFPDFRSC